MEVKINKEIREYTEAIFFGLSLRQCICSLLACGTAVAIYFIFRPILSKSVVCYIENFKYIIIFSEILQILNSLKI